MGRTKRGVDPRTEGPEVQAKDLVAQKLPAWREPDDLREAKAKLNQLCDDLYLGAAPVYYQIGRHLIWIQGQLKEQKEDFKVWFPENVNRFSIRTAYLIIKWVKVIEESKGNLTWDEALQLEWHPQKDSSATVALAPLVKSTRVINAGVKALKQMKPLKDKDGDVNVENFLVAVNAFFVQLSRIGVITEPIDVTPEKEKAKDDSVIEIDALPALKGEGTWDCIQRNGGCGKIDIPTANLTCPECKSPRRKVQPLTAVAGGTARIQQRKVRYKAQKPKNKRGKTGGKKK